MAEYDESSHKIKSFDLLDFEKQNSQDLQKDCKKLISDVVDVYAIKNNLFLTQLCQAEEKQNIISAISFDRDHSEQHNDNISNNININTIENHYLNYTSDGIFE